MSQSSEFATKQAGNVGAGPECGDNTAFSVSASAAQPLPAKTGAPPRPRLAFRVGVVGHRPNRLVKDKEPELRAVLGQLLAHVKADVESAWDAELYSETNGQRAVLRAVSPLAEGADRLFAEQALDLGCMLCCVMPFAQAEFEKDFAPGSAIEANALAGFRDLLARARQDGRLASYELDGVRSDAAAAYSAAGRVVLNQSDLLVVIWDGERQGKRGGTEETFDDAIDRGVPCVWIDARNPQAWQIVDAEHPLPSATSGARAVPSSSTDPDRLGRVVRGLLEIPRPSRIVAAEPAGVRQPTEEPREHLKTFLGERKPAFSTAVVWGVFQKLLGDNRRPRVEFTARDYEEAVEDEWPRDRTSPAARVTDALRPFYAWPDKLAVLYGNRYRSAFLLAFLLAAVAVGMALLPVGAQLAAHGRAETVCVAFELAAISVILLLVWRGRRQRWHERWLDYRTVAELVRHLRLVAPLGGVRPMPPIPAHWTTYGQPPATWMAWYVRAVERDLGLPAAVVDKAHLRACLVQLNEALDGQIEYHGTNEVRNDRLERRLHRGGMLLLWLTLLACGLHYSASLWQWHLPPGLLAGLTFCCGFFPALGAALAGIVNQGEFPRIRKRSEAMKEALALLRKEMGRAADQLEGEPEPFSQQYSPLVSARASAAARLLVHEVLDWRVVFLDRPLTAPT